MITYSPQKGSTSERRNVENSLFKGDAGIILDHSAHSSWGQVFVFFRCQEMESRLKSALWNSEIQLSHFIHNSNFFFGDQDLTPLQAHCIYLQNIYTLSQGATL